MTHTPAARPLSRRAVALALLLPLALAGCAGLGIGGGPPLDAWELRAPADPVVARRSLARDLVIEPPEAGPAVDTDRILVRPNPLQAQYLPGARWTTSAPEMLRAVMVRALEDTNGFRYVGRRPIGPGADFALVSELTDLQAELNDTGPGARVRMRLTARLVREDDAAVLASRSFIATADVDSLDTLELITAFNATSDRVMADLSQWVLGRLGAGVTG